MKQRWSAAFFAAAFALVPIASRAQVVTPPRLDAATLRARLAHTMAPAGKPMPSDAAHLDALLSQKSYLALRQRLLSAIKPSDILLDMNWEQGKIYNGANFLISYAYMVDAWRLGSSLSSPAREELKGTAGLFYLYTFSVAISDGPKCADATAPGHRVDQLVLNNRSVGQYLFSLPRAERMSVGSMAAALETATASVRSDDDVLCSFGMAEMGHDLAAQGGKPLQEVPSAPGVYGKTYVIPSDPRYRPGFVSADQWMPKQAQARAALPATLTRLLTPPDEATPPAPAK